MKRYLHGCLVLIFCVCTTTVLLADRAFSQSCVNWVAKAVSVQGVVEAQRYGESQWQKVDLNATYCPNDKIRTQIDSRASFTLINDSTLRVNQNSTFSFSEPKDDTSFLLYLLKGAAHIFSRTPRALEVQTPHTSAGVRGTEFLVTVESEKTVVTVYEGAVLAHNDQGDLNLNSGQSAITESGKAPVHIIIAHPRDAVRWALYYPPVMYIQQPLEKGDNNDPRYLVQKASRKLHLGQVDNANLDITEALALQPNNVDALALQTIIAVVQNDKEKAMQLAQKGVRSNPRSSTALIALSYAQQAAFDLEGARISLEKAVEIDSQNGLAWARLAEIWSGSGRLDKSLDAAKKAEGIAPTLSRTQTVLGYAYLTKVETAKARDAFTKAISFDQADPLPRLGLGLAIIRDGDLMAGSREIEIAASLDPNNSLIRSYLGKTYYEQKRSKLDGREYAIAKELDPNDPTPWFYDAIRKQTINRPVEALQDMQKAIELNDNRAVYRSQMMLDSDLASRSSSLARIYNDLGFQQRGLVEGWNSVNTDPTNFSAHRFLADTYSALPRHEIARVSELLQSQLLQPINITPIQPRLAESSLSLIGNQGPSAAGFNTYNPLFNRNGGTAQLSGLIGGNSTWGGEGVASAIYDKLSLSAGYSGFGTDGYRENNDQQLDIANFFAQYQVTSTTSIQAEYRYRKDESGDLEKTFFSDDFRPYLRQDDKTNSFRVGFHQNFAFGHDLIGNFQYSDGRNDRHDENRTLGFISPVLNIDLENDTTAFSGELSYLLKSKKINMIAGGGHFDIDSTDNISSSLGFGFSPPLFLNEFNADTGSRHSNVYLYTYFKPLNNITLTVGGGGDLYGPKADIVKDQKQFNPKFGMSWRLGPSTTLRGAAFRVLKRTLVTNQTLEPTQVAGFNQFFDEFNATDYWRYGGAIDQIFSDNIFGGFEYTYRDLTVPVMGLVGSSPDSGESEWKESLLRSYLFWTPCSWASITAEYRYESLERESKNALNTTDSNTHYLPLGIKLFQKSGVTCSLKGTYLYQKGLFDRKDTRRIYENESDDFWLFDAYISYRLPQRRGFLTVGINNILEQEFDYLDVDIEGTQVQPERLVFFKFTLTLP